jgi:hypothetical protein
MSWRSRWSGGPGAASQRRAISHFSSSRKLSHGRQSEALVGCRVRCSQRQPSVTFGFPQCLGSSGRVGNSNNALRSGLSSHWPAPEQQKEFSLTAAADWGSSRTCRPGLAGARCCLSSSAVVEGSRDRQAGRLVAFQLRTTRAAHWAAGRPGPSLARPHGSGCAMRHGHTRGQGAKPGISAGNVTTTKVMVIPITTNSR